MKARSANKKTSVYSVLIVCEGQNTEPKYFAEFAKYLNENFRTEYPNGIEFSIFPYDIDEIEIDKGNQFLVRKVGKRKVLNFESIITDDVEDDYCSAPERWVRYAQKKAENSGFNEVWSVFDYDNRAATLIERAYQLANMPIDEDGGIVKIAYSSYSFEYWLLLHYELCLNYLAYSECKDSDREIINCSGNKSPKTGDCKGKKCLGGYLRANGYEVGFYNKSTKSTFPAIEKYINKARYNATHVRSQPKNVNKNIWEIMPVTTVDTLIDSLIKYPFSIKWKFESNSIKTSDFILDWSIDKKNILGIHISPLLNKTILISKDDVKLLNIDFEEYLIPEKILIKEDKKYSFKKIDISKLHIKAIYISIKYKNSIYINKI